jgi:integrase
MRVVREGPVKITKAAIEAAWRRRSSEQRLVLGDAECRGLALVVNATSMSWIFAYKPRGLDPVSGTRFSSRSITIGSPQSHSPDDARAVAGQHKGSAKSGKDPAQERKAQIASSAKDRGQTIGRLIDTYATALPKRPKMRGSGIISARQAAAEIVHLRKAIETINAEAKPASDISSDHLRTMLKLCADKAATARHRFGAMSRFFDWAIDEGIVTLNPCLQLAKGRRPRAVSARQRFLTLPETAALWQAAGNLDPLPRDLVRFFIAVPSRRGEAASMDWSHINMAEAIWSQPGHMTKNRDAHRIYLPTLAMEILTARHLAAGKPTSGLVFPAPRSGKVIDTFGDIKAALNTQLPSLADWRFHDLRRTFATALGEAGISEAVADAILNHRQSATRGGVLGVYQLAQRWPEQVAAMKHWGDALLDAINSDGVKLNFTNDRGEPS